MSAPSNLFRIKQNDTSPSIVEYLRSADRKPIANIATVQFHLLAPDGTIKVNQPATLVSGVTAKVQYDWQVGDTNTAGMFGREWECTLVSGRVVTVPNDQNYPVEIFDDIA